MSRVHFRYQMLKKKSEIFKDCYCELLDTLVQI